MKQREDFEPVQSNLTAFDNKTPSFRFAASGTNLSLGKALQIRGTLSSTNPPTATIINGKQTETELTLDGTIQFSPTDVRPLKAKSTNDQ